MAIDANTETNDEKERSYMKATKILENEIKDLKISSLPTRPTAPIDSGGKGYSSEQMKAAFDRLPLFIIERFNLLIEDLCAVGQDSIAAEIKTGIGDHHSLNDLFSDIQNGNILSYLSAGDCSLAMLLADIQERLTRLEEKNEQN